MKKLVSVAACVVAIAGFSPAAFAGHHRHHAAHAAVVAPVGNPVMDAQGQFYATPVNAGPAGAGAVPGLDIIGGVAQPVLAVPGAVVGGVVEPALAVPGAVLPVVTP